MAHQYGHGGKEEQRGFFATTLGCCTPTMQPADGQKNASHWASEDLQSGPVTMTFEQPQKTEAMPRYVRPMTSASMGRSRASFWSSTVSTTISTTEGRPRKLARRTPRASTFSLYRPWTSSGNRPTIGAPTNFRRLSDPLQMESQPKFRKLELSIYLPSGALSPLPDFSKYSWDSDLSDLAMPKPAYVKPTAAVEEIEETKQSDIQIRRKPLSVSSVSSVATTKRKSSYDRDSFTLGNEPGPTLMTEDWHSSLPGLASVSETEPLGDLRKETLITLPLRRRTSSASRPSTAQTPLRIASPEPIQGRSRSLSDTLRNARTQAAPRKSKTNDTIDEAIRELNTIVEERRANTQQQGSNGTTLRTVPGSQPQHHVPAIAPSMKVRARSETLTDIGSAFSIPLTNNAPLHSPGSSIFASVFPPQPIAAPPAAVLKPNPTTRLRSWLKRSVQGSDSVSPTSPLSPAPFYMIDADPKDAYTHLSSPTLSSVSTLTDDDSDSSPTESYPATTTTGLSTPLGFGPFGSMDASANKFFLESEAMPRPSTSTTSSFSQRAVTRLQQPPKKRGISGETSHTVHTTHSRSSSVGTSILGVQTRYSRSGAPHPGTEVGMAF